MHFVRSVARSGFVCLVGSLRLKRIIDIIHLVICHTHSRIGLHDFRLGMTLLLEVCSMGDIFSRRLSQVFVS